MATMQEAGIMSILSDKISLPASTQELQEQFKNAKPFPHLVIDNMFRDDVLDGVLNEIPPLTDDKWVHERRERLSKSNLRSAVEFQEAGYQFASFINSAKFLYLMTELSGVRGLLPDPYMGGAGFHVVPKGGQFDVHADRNIDQNTGLRRRLVMLTYLNKNWDHEFGGQLELWDTSGSRCERVVEPIFNRTVIFEVADQNFHGVRPVVVDGRARQSFAAYFHTVPDDSLIPHASVYAPSFYSKREPLVKRVMKEFTPPAVFRAKDWVKSRVKKDQY
ncbi:2OG-Fe(II) oxygenase [Silvibacterium sp.]|uniref:2OG-Fe(II) oxygenase n=1 Tax=Silvibacterium sp. TaxID=1964179 RepID=UPI0039E64675